MKAAADLRLRMNKAVSFLKAATPLLMAGYSENPCKDIEREKVLQTATKSSVRDLVTRYDKDVEAFLSLQLRKEFPGELVLGEEALSKDGISLKQTLDGKDHFWLIDPIDGTKNYCRAYPYFCSTMAFVIREGTAWVPKVGITLDPLRSEFFSAFKGGGAFYNDQEMKVSNVSKSEGSLFSSGFAAARKGFADHAFQSFRNVSETSLGVRRGGSAALDLAYVACGRIDGYWERGLDSWDTAAGMLLVQEASGKCSHYDGSVIDFMSGEIVATNTHMHDWLLKALKTT